MKKIKSNLYDSQKVNNPESIFGGNTYTTVSDGDTAATGNFYDLSFDTKNPDGTSVGTDSSQTGSRGETTDAPLK